MVKLHEAETDADLDAWREVRLAILPDERTATVQELRGMWRPGRGLLLAEIDGIVVGHGVTDRSDLAGRATVTPRVLPQYRRHGVGTELLRALTRMAVEAGHTRAASDVDDEGSLAFARRFGFTEVDRQVEQVREIGDEPKPTVPDGLGVVTVAERPELWAVAYHEVAAEALKDMAVISPMEVSLSDWERDWINAPEATFLALADSGVVGLASVMLDPGRPARAEQGFTAVRREWRGRHVASTLKRMILWWASQNGIDEIYTWTQQGNDDMRRVNEHLGFRYGHVSIRVEAPLPLAALD